MTTAEAAQRLESLPAGMVKIRLVELLERHARQGTPTRNIMYYLNTLFYEAEPRLTKAGESGRAKIATLVKQAGG